MLTLVRRAKLSDTAAISAVQREAFPRQRESETWVYATVLGAKIVATIEDLYSAAEVLMVAECPDA